MPSELGDAAKSLDSVLTYRSVGQAGRVAVSATFSDGTQFVDKLDATSARARRSFVDRCLVGHPGLSRDGLMAEIDRIGAEVASELSDEGASILPEQDGVDGVDGADGRVPNTSVRDRILDLAEDGNIVELFHSPGREESVAYATIRICGHLEVCRIDSKRFRWWVVGEFRRGQGSSPPTQALEEAIQAFIGIALHEGPEHLVSIRVAEHHGDIFIDLANEDGDVAHVGKYWREIIPGDKCPVRFFRSRGMESLPRPHLILADDSEGFWDALVDGLSEFREIINIGDDNQWTLLLGYMVACLYPRGPYPILVVHGEQGSGKSFLVRMVRSVIDPFRPAMRRPPREDRDLMIAANNGWVQCFDNISGLSPWLSASMCSLATGGGFATRELYTNMEEILFDATRPIIVNGIEEVATRSDFLDRAIILRLPVISEEKRRDETELMSMFDQIRPVVFGRLLDALSAVLRRRDWVELPAKPRMADFALVASRSDARRVG